MLVALCCSYFISKVKQLKTGMSKFDEMIDSLFPRVKIICLGGKQSQSQI